MAASNKFIPGIASQSLGNPKYHGIRGKLIAAKSAGMQAVEIFFEDIAQLARALQKDSNAVDRRFLPVSFQRSEWEHAVLASAKQIGSWCTIYSLQVICLQPMMHFEGVLDPDRRADNLHRLHLWIEIAKALNTDLIQIPSNFLSREECTGEISHIVADLRQAAQIGAQQSPVIRFAYEALCWGTYINTWDAAWEIVEAVDMDNFGTCLDTFNIAGRIYADPKSSDGKTLDAERNIQTSIQKLAQVFSKPKNLNKVFYVELCDGESLSQPMSSQHEWFVAEQPSRMTWSRNARLFPFETCAQEARLQARGIGYLPVWEIFATLVGLGFEGFVSFEVFNRSLNKADENVVGEHSERARISWQRCLQKLDQDQPVLDKKTCSQSLGPEEASSRPIKGTLRHENMKTDLNMQPRL